MSGQIRLGIVGFGRIVELVHLPALKRVPEIGIGGVYDLTPQRLELAAKRGLPVYPSLERLLDAPIDAVLIATPPSSHFPLAAQAMRQGKHVMLEKPVTRTAEEAEQLLAIARMTGRTVSVFHNRRFDPDYELVRRALAEDWLGQVLFVERRHQMFGSGASFGVKSFRPQWRNEGEFGGGALLDWGVHLLDQLLQLRLGRIERVLSAHTASLRWQQGDAEDLVHASFRLDNGIVLSCDVNFGSNAALPLWIVGGERATLQVGPEREALLLAKGQPARRFELPQANRGGPQRLYAAFAGCLLRGERPAVTLDEAAEAMRAIAAIREKAAM
ncbi:Gfo/Idh/MocA family protein [Cohnella cellulosilytica]|uniref:Gfo/Idh/MocA family protein n=1 Tax=Cohnella cellulosilytica TaxID=986710 RepID=A0ABW2FB94_9BACL